MNKQQETIDKVKVALTNLNAILQECRDQDISIMIEVDRKDTMSKDMLYCHQNNKISFSLHEAYKIENLQ